MKYSSFETHWDEIKGQLKQRFGQLTDDDLKFVSGKGEELFARLRQKLSMSEQELETTVRDLQAGVLSRLESLKVKASEIADGVRTKVTHAVEHAKTSGAAAVDEMKMQAEAAYIGARKRVRTLQEDGEDYVRHNPRQSLFAALCAGFIVGLLIRR